MGNFKAMPTLYSEKIQKTLEIQERSELLLEVRYERELFR